jgi:peptide deformylase
MENPLKLTIVPVDQIPEGLEIPDDLCPEKLAALYRLAGAMSRLCLDQHGIGLSAVQVGKPLNLFVMRQKSMFECYVNASYEGHGNTKRSIEGCLSIRGKNGEAILYEVNRFTRITVYGKRFLVNGKPPAQLEEVAMSVTGHQAIVMQHEIDHQRGVLISQIGRLYSRWSKP